MELEPSSRVVARLNHAIVMLAGLIPHIDSEELPPIIQIACIEDWLTNHRLLIEFFVIPPKDNRVHAKSLIAEWQPSAEAKSVLGREYGWASEMVSHIGWPADEWEGPLDQTDLRSRALVVLEVVEHFADALTAADNAYDALVHLALRDAKKLMASG